MPPLALEPLQIPQHVAIIPDGNRRWAKEHGVPTAEGHMRGYERISEISQTAQEMGIKTLTVWGLSTENWQRREPAEMEQLFKIFMRGLRLFAREARRHNIHIRHLGRKDRLPSILINYLKRLEENTVQHTDYQLNIALDYGGRDEILRAVRKLMDSGIPGSQLDEALFSQYLDTQSGPDPDLIIRTSGEQRLSGLMPWQGAYAEYYFSPLYLPDFGPDQFRQAIAEYGQRNRRFGK